MRHRICHVECTKSLRGLSRASCAQKDREAVAVKRRARCPGILAVRPTDAHSGSCCPVLQCFPRIVRVLFPIIPGPQEGQTAVFHAQYFVQEVSDSPRHHCLNRRRGAETFFRRRNIFVSGFAVCRRTGFYRGGKSFFFGPRSSGMQRRQVRGVRPWCAPRGVTESKRINRAACWERQPFL